MKRISIIIPVYNSEKFLAETLRSVAAQTYSNLEVILIDDGSTDHSGDICKAQTRTDGRFHYYKIENAGPSGARNAGLMHATGEYIGFCDSDDLIDPNMYQTMVTYIEQHSADIVFCDIFSERDQCKFGFPWPDSTLFHAEEIGQRLVGAFVGNKSDDIASNPLWGSVVRCLFKAEKIKKEAIYFPQDIHFAEDLVFTLRYLQKSDVAVICNKVLYHYRCNPDSIMNSFFSYKNGMFLARKKLLSYLSDIIENFSAEGDLQKRLMVTTRCYFRECVGNACRPGAGRTEKDKKQELKEILNDRQVVAAFENFDSVNWKTRMIYLMIKYKIALGIQVYYSLRFRKR